MKKASANIWWIIIGAVIALVVMIILMVSFVDKTRSAETGLSSCEGKGGVCDINSEGCPSKTLSSRAFQCSTGTCCIGTPKSCKVKAECGDKETCKDYKSGGVVKKYCIKENVVPGQ